MLAWVYWHVNRPFVAAFAETILGYGEGDFKVEGRKIVRQIDRFLHDVNTAVFLQFIGTLATLPLYVPPVSMKWSLQRALTIFWYGVKSFFSHVHFLLCSRQRRSAWVERMYQGLIQQAPEQEDEMVKTIVTLSLFKATLGVAYLDQEQLWRALEYKPFQQRSWNPPSGPDLDQPPRTAPAKLLHELRQSPRQVTVKPPDQLTYCVIGSGAGGAVAAHTIKERNPKARVLLLETGPLVTNDQFEQTVLPSMSRLYMNGALTLAQDQQFLFQQGRCVGGSTVVNNSVAFKPEDFWWKDLKQRWQALGVRLEYDDLYRQYDVLSEALHVAPVDHRLITKGAYTVRDGFEKLRQMARVGDVQLASPITVPSNVFDCIGCGRCNIGCQYDAKQSLLATLIPRFVQAGGILVPDAKVSELELRQEGGRGRNRRSQVVAVRVDDASGSVRIEADRFILASGAYASSKLLWRSGFIGAAPGVRTVGKRFSVNAGTPVIGIFPERQNAFLGQQIGFALELPEERMIIETAFAPPAVAGLGLPAWGKEFQRQLRRVNHMMTGVPVFATLAYGQIKPGLLGDSGYVIDFTLMDEDWRRLERGMKITARAMFAMGAEEVFINRFDARTLKREEDLEEYFAGIGPSHFITVQSAHMQGGNVIAPQPYYGVVDENLKVYGIDNLWICDASVIPAPITINIALTVMALSRYAAVRIADAA